MMELLITLVFVMIGFITLKLGFAAVKRIVVGIGIVIVIATVLVMALMFDLVFTDIIKSLFSFNFS